MGTRRASELPSSGSTVLMSSSSTGVRWSTREAWRCVKAKWGLITDGGSSPGHSPGQYRTCLQLTALPQGWGLGPRTHLGCGKEPGTSNLCSDRVFWGHCGKSRRKTVLGAHANSLPSTERWYETGVSCKNSVQGWLDQDLGPQETLSSHPPAHKRGHGQR